MFIVFVNKQIHFVKHFFVCLNSVQGHMSNPVLAVKRSLFVEIRFAMSIFFRPPERYLHWAYIATLDRPVACQMTKLEHIKG